MVCSAGRSGAVVPVLVLFFVALCLFCGAICCMSFHVSFCSCVFGPFGIAIASLGEERANLSAFRTFIQFVLVWICRFPFLLGILEGLRFVMVALPGLFSYLFFFIRGVFGVLIKSSILLSLVHLEAVIHDRGISLGIVTYFCGP